jgi:hypothetical protein
MRFVSEDLNKMMGIHPKIDELIKICQEEWAGDTSRIGSFKVGLTDNYSLVISFSPRFHFENSDNLEKIQKIIKNIGTFDLNINFKK